MSWPPTYFVSNILGYMYGLWKYIVVFKFCDKSALCLLTSMRQVMSDFQALLDFCRRGGVAPAVVNAITSSQASSSQLTENIIKLFNFSIPLNAKGKKGPGLKGEIGIAWL